MYCLILKRGEHVGVRAADGKRVPLGAFLKGQPRWTAVPAPAQDEPGALWPWGQGVRRQRCSPTSPADGVLGGTRHWGSQADPGVLVTALEAWTYWGGFWLRDTQAPWKAPATKPWAATGQLGAHRWSELMS